jgi:micrococcal nuclease
MPSTITLIGIALGALFLFDRYVGLPWIGRVTRVVDGDSVETKTRGEMRRIRLSGVDAPEYRQGHGKTARTELARRVEGRLILFVPNGLDKYGRFPCVMVTTSGMVSWGMAFAGHAWPDSIATGLIHLPSRMLRRGLWANGRVHPKVWRMANPRVR